MRRLTLWLLTRPVRRFLNRFRGPRVPIRRTNPKPAFEPLEGRAVPGSLLRQLLDPVWPMAAVVGIDAFLPAYAVSPDSQFQSSPDTSSLSPVPLTDMGNSNEATTPAPSGSSGIFLLTAFDEPDGVFLGELVGWDGESLTPSRAQSRSS
jgi:hypothetical protein